MRWQFVLLGIIERNEITEKLDLSAYSLSDLIKANKIVGSNNKRKEKLADYHREKGHKVKGRTISMLIDDRLIAAIYTALHFEPRSEIIAIINDRAVVNIRPNYGSSQTEEEEE